VNIITINKRGDKLLDIIQIDEERLELNMAYQPLSGSIILVECKGKYLFGFNKWRKQWELPGGSRNKKEKPEQCAIRELYEETNQKIQYIKFLGLLKINKQATKKIAYYALYYSYLDQLEPFKENNEMQKILLWDMKKQIGYVDEIDKYIIDYYLTHN